MSGGTILQATASLIAVLALAGLAGLAARRRLPQAGGQGALRLRATIVLDARRRLHLIETDHGAALALTGGATDQIVPWPAR